MQLIKTDSFRLAVYAKGDPHAEKFALVLPGKLDTKDYAHMRSHVDFLSTKGFFALSFDPPGTWESEGDINLYNMTNYLKAINELIAYHGNKPTFIMGHSRGSSMSIISGLRNQYVTAFAPVFCSLKVDGTWEKADPEWREKGYLASMRDLPPGGGPKIKEFLLPYSFYEDQLHYSVADELRQSTKPKLFFLGKYDKLAKPESVRDLYDIAAEPKELHELESDHDYRFHPELIEEVNMVVSNFLDKYLL